MHIQRTRARCDNSGKSLEVARVQECIRGERFLGDSWHGVELNKRICGGSGPIDKIHKSDERGVRLGRGTEVSNGRNERECVYL